MTPLQMFGGVFVIGSILLLRIKGSPDETELAAIIKCGMESQKGNFL